MTAHSISTIPDFRRKARSRSVSLDSGVDKKRCEKAKITADQTVFKTKHQQALEMVFMARKNGARFKWVGFDMLAKIEL